MTDIKIKSAEDWFDENCDSDDASGQNFWQISKGSIKDIQVDALRSAFLIADTFALNHKLSAPEVIIAIQIRDAIERLVKEIEK